MKNKKYAVLVIFAVTAAAFLVSNAHVQSQANPSPQMKLGGAFIGGGRGAIWNALQIPLDSAGRSAAIRVHNVTDGPALAGLLAAFDADTLTEATGQGEMISRDTLKATWLAYGTKQGSSPGESAVVRLIAVLTGTGTFTGPDSLAVNYTIDIYLPAADADGDGFPDPGTTPVLSVPGSTTGKRVTP